MWQSSCMLQHMLSLQTSILSGSGLFKAILHRNITGLNQAGPVPIKIWHLFQVDYHENNASLLKKKDLSEFITHRRVTLKA